MRWCPRELMDVLSAVMILAVATFTPEVRRLIARLPLPLPLAKGDSARSQRTPTGPASPSANEPTAPALDQHLTLGLPPMPGAGQGSPQPLQKAPC